MRVSEPIQMFINTPLRIQCQLTCHADTPLSNCNISHHWILFLPYHNEGSKSIRISTISEGNRNSTINGLGISLEQFPPDPCTNQAQTFLFFITLLMHYYTPELREFFVICGLRKFDHTIKVHDSHDPLNIVTIKTRDESVLLYSTDIDENPHKEIFEGGNVSFTCTRPSDSLVTPLWQLTSSNPFLSNLIINESISIPVNNYTQLQVILKDGEQYYNDTNLQQVQNSTVTLVNLPSTLGKLTFWCGIEMEDGQHRFYNRTATVTVKGINLI